MSEHIDNSSRRKATLKALIRQLHEGKSVEDVKAEFAKLLQDVSAGEIAEIEQALIAEGLPEMEVKRLCDVHVAVFRESLDAQSAPEEQPGHPVHTFRAENEAAEAVLSELERAIDETDWPRAHKLLDILREYEVHYLRKENILFPYLEQHGFSGPSSVMWAIHDDIRAEWKALDRLLSAGASDDPAVHGERVKAAFASAATAMREMSYKEEHILFPASLERLTPGEWLAAREQESELGYAYIQPGDQWPPEEAPAEQPATPVSDAAVSETGATGLLSLDTGALTVEQVRLMLSHLPLDITFVDAEDRVRFYSHGEERIFPRSAAVIGREVLKCHPPHSAHRVQQILDDFRAGSRDVAEFWIQMGPEQAEGRFIHIRYFAVRDETGAYRGTLEVAQDLTPLRALEGERRLLDEEEQT